MTGRSPDRTHSPDPEADDRGTPASDRVRVRRDTRRKGRYDRGTVDAILDATPFCHLAYVHDGHPIVIPTLQVRVGDHVYVHASSGSRMGLTAERPWPVSLSVTLIDGLVMARSGFHHSVNYRSCVVVGEARLVEDEAEKLAALDATVDHVAPGRSSELRRPTERELMATVVARLPLDEASAKVRSGPPLDEPDDLDAPVWAGVIPMETTYGAPVPAPDLAAGVAVSPSVRRLLGWED